jgi:hypothetical protein
MREVARVKSFLRFRMQISITFPQDERNVHFFHIWLYMDRWKCLEAVKRTIITLLWMSSGPREVYVHISDTLPVQFKQIGNKIIRSIVLYMYIDSRYYYGINRNFNGKCIFTEGLYRMRFTLTLIFPLTSL